jgi:RNA polymerase sigma-70 factor (ECF subfamily)
MESVWVMQLMNGSLPAFDQLYRRYYEAVLHNALKITKDRVAAEDIVQEVFITLWEKRNALVHPGNIAGWLFVTGSNKSLNYLRRELRRKEQPLSAENIQDLTYSINAPLFAEAQLQLLEKAIEALPPQRQRAFRLCRLEGKTYEEAADILQVAKSTIKDHLSKATDAIRDYVGRQPVEQEWIFPLLLSVGIAATC